MNAMATSWATVPSTTGMMTVAAFALAMSLSGAVQFGNISSWVSNHATGRYVAFTPSVERKSTVPVVFKRSSLNSKWIGARRALI